MGVMGHLQAMKERQNTTDAMFEPLQQTIALLKVYEQELPDVVYKQLEVRTNVQSLHILCAHTYSCFFEPRWSHFTYFFSVSSNRSTFVLPSSSRQFIICHSCLPCFYLCLFISLSLYLSICLSVGVAREVEQCEEAGSVGQTAGGASAGHRGGQPASKVCLIRCGAAHLPGALPQQRALQVEFIPALISFGTFYFNTTCHQTM